MAGKGTGKLGSMVYATVRGTQIVRQYNPVVFNPNTEKQSLQRARFSALTKLAAMVSPSLVFQGKGAMVTNRNAFIKANFGKFEEDRASLQFNDLTLSGSNIEASTYPVVTVNDQTRMMEITIQAGTTLLAGFGYAVILVTDDEEGTTWVRSGIANSNGQTMATVGIQLPNNENISNVVVIGYPMYYKDGATKVSYANTIMGGYYDNDVRLSLMYNRMASKGDLLVYATKPLAKTV